MIKHTAHSGSAAFNGCSWSCIASKRLRLRHRYHSLHVFDGCLFVIGLLLLFFVLLFRILIVFLVILRAKSATATELDMSCVCGRVVSSSHLYQYGLHCYIAFPRLSQALRNAVQLSCTIAFRTWPRPMSHYLAQRLQRRASILAPLTCFPISASFCMRHSLHRGI